MVATVMGTKHCVRGGNGDDFLSPCSSLVSNEFNVVEQQDFTTIFDILKFEFFSH